MRTDSIGLFWEDLPPDPDKTPAMLPPIPDTGWRPPAYFPDLSSAKVIGLDVETYDPELLTHGPGWARGVGHIVGISVAVPGAKWYFPMRHEVQPEFNIDPAAVLAWAREQLGRPHQHKVGANLIYDVGWLLQEGVVVAGPLHDVQNQAALLTENEPVGLDYLGERWLGVGKTSEELYRWAWLAFGGPRNGRQRKNIYRCPPALVGPYAEDDADLPLRLAEIFFPMMQALGVMDVYNMETALTPLLVRMRMAGVAINVPAAQELRDDLEVRENAALDILQHTCGWRINVNSADELARAFRAEGLDYPKTAKGAPSFRKEFLKGLDHPLAKQVMEVRRLSKLKTTFVEGYLLGKSINGRIHGSFHQLRSDDGGARSGRFASSDPNLQNLPIRDEELGPLIRAAFMPEPGHKDWAKIDLSQIEYRFLAHFAVGRGSDEVRHKFISDPKTDYHEYTQAIVKEHTGQEIKRKPIKNINFGLIYGMGEDKLGRDLGLDRKKANELFRFYHKALPFAKETMAAAVQEAEETGLVRTIMGRASRFEFYQPSGRGGQDAIGLPYADALAAYGQDIELAYTHKALNRKLQGSAADAMKKAMLDCYNAGVFDVIIPRLTVHDELDFSMPGTPESEEALKETQWRMENAIPLRIPVIAEVDRGAHWGECG